MKNIMRRSITLFILFFSVFLLTGCQGQDTYGVKIIFTGEHDLDRAIAVDGDLLMMEGQAVLEPDAAITGSIFMLGGKLTLQGEVLGSVTVLGGTLQIEEGASIRGNLNIGGGEIERHLASRVDGRVIEGVELPTEWVTQTPTPGEQIRGTLLQMLLVGGLGALLQRYAPRPLRRVQKVIRDHTLVSAAVGVLAGLVGLVMLIQLAFTVILIPVSILGLALFLLMVTFGWIAMGAWLGEKMKALFSMPLSDTIFTGVGAALVSLLTDIILLVPIVGAPLMLLVASLCIGACLLTHLGFRAFIPRSDTDML